MSRNRVVYFVKRPDGMVTNDTFAIREEPMPVLSDTESVIIESVYASVDPYMRGRMSNRKSYTAPFQVGQSMQGGMVGRIYDPGRTDLAKGAWVFGVWPWAEYAQVKAQTVRPLAPGTPPTASLHVLGLTGLTAYIGLTQFGRPVTGEQLVVSAAAGSVGSLAGQIGKILGLRVVGIAGGPEKCAWLVDRLGFDAAVDYRHENFPANLKNAVPDGVDVYFDNVGGTVTDCVMAKLNLHARVVICGQISLYNLDSPADQRPRFSDLLISRAQATGFIVGDHQALYPEALEHLSVWYREGRLVAEETLVDGFDQLIDAFIGLFHGANRGKAIVKLREETGADDDSYGGARTPSA